MVHSALLNVMIGAARKASRGLKRDFGELEKLQVSVKSPANFASAADQRAEEVIYTELAKGRPGYGFLGEEGGSRDGADKSHRWIVDPLDGTTNFLHGIPHFATSIALERDGAIVAGIVYNPATDELFVAEKGKGAFLNDRRIRVAARRTLGEAVISCAMPHLGRGSVPQNHEELSRIQPYVAGLRRSGATSLDLAYVAAGRFDGCWERDVQAWDLAAGVILIREAGGFVTDLDGRDEMLARGHVTAGNETIHRELLHAVSKVGNH